MLCIYLFSDDDQPLVSLRKINKKETVTDPRQTSKSAESRSAKKKLLRNLRWVAKDPPVVTESFKGKFRDPAEEIPAPIAYNRKFFNEEMLENIATETNLYSVQHTGNLINTNKDEIEQYLGVVMQMGIFVFPKIKMFWNSKWRYSSMADIMPENRFS